MIKNEAIAREISELMLDVGKRLDKSVALVLANCSEAEFETYRQAVGAVLAEMLLDILNPLYVEHPLLKPPELQ
jgi:hypothetical protein